MNFDIAPYFKKFQELQLHGTKKAPLKLEEEQEVVCLNCGTHYHGKFCPNCGQKSKTGPLSITHAFGNLSDIIFNIEQGFFHTCLELLYRPGHMMRDYVKGHRVEYIRPIQLLFVLTTIYVVLSYFLNHSLAALFDPSALLDEALTDETGHPAGKKELLLQMIRQFFQNKAYAAILTAVMMVIPSWLVFRKVNKQMPVTVSEMFFILIYISSQQLLLSILLLPYDHFFRNNDESMDLCLPMFLLVWDFRQYFQIGWRKAIRRSFLSYVVLFSLFIVIALLTGGTIYMTDFDFVSLIERIGVKVEIH